MQTRRTFSDSITHLIFKNGSNATLRKALGKNIIIVNLLWITYCKREGKRLSEKDFLIDRPQGIILSAKKRRKSMEPGKVKALHMESSAGTEPKRKRQRSDSVSEPRTRRLSEKDPVRRKHNATWEAKDIPEPKLSTEQELAQFEDSEEEKVAVAPEPAPKRVEKKRESALFTPEMRERSDQIKAQIKADFFVANVDSPKPSSPKPSRLSVGSCSTPLRRKRRSLGNPPRLPASTPEPMPLNPTRAKPTIIMTGMTHQAREKCSSIIRQLGTYDVGTFVDDRTTHVIVGAKRRTESVLSGMVQKAWLVKPEWLFKSAKAEKYVDESEFEAIEFFERAQHARTSSNNLLPSNLHIFIHSVHALSKDAMEKLVTRVNGKVVDCINDADVVISKKPLDTDIIVVNENWLFSCIEQWRYLLVDKFAFKK
ncbi:hypothetical protein BJV82DRAFT_197021 [Fennellomyces sp. T-0311]|nr:hypothetical protein BJV82DRAFT_197021 [Fennellomyces sp. T-0311]